MKKYNILCPEYVPMDNKGEEAIMQGMADTIFPDGNCRFHIFDWACDHVYENNKLIVHPAKYYFSKWRSQEFKLGFNLDDFYASSSSLLRNGLNKLYPNWLMSSHQQAKILDEKLKVGEYYEGFLNLNDIDYIIAGHNGGLDEYVCHLLDVYSKNNKPFGVYGTSMKPRLTNKTIIKIFENTLKKSEFIITRNPYAYEWCKKNLPNLEVELAPDPAFGMKPLNNDEVEKFLENENLLNFFAKPVVTLTTAEPAPIARHSFNSLKSPKAKINAHRNFLAEVLKYINSKGEFNILFLPHTLGKDIEIANDVINRASLNNHPNIKILNKDTSARMLKGIIKRSYLLVAERVHSVIGAVGVNTPFLCLGSEYDLRIQGIIKNMLNCENQIYWLNNPDVNSVQIKIDETFNNIERIKHHLNIKNEEFEKILKEKGDFIREKITSYTN